MFFQTLLRSAFFVTINTSNFFCYFTITSSTNITPFLPFVLISCFKSFITVSAKILFAHHTIYFGNKVKMTFSILFYMIQKYFSIILYTFLFPILAEITTMDVFKNLSYLGISCTKPGLSNGSSTDLIKFWASIT